MMGVHIKGSPSEGIYRLTYQETSDKGMVAVLEGEDITFVGQIVKAPHGRLIDADELEEDDNWSEWEDGFISYSRLQISTQPTVIEAEVE